MTAPARRLPHRIALIAAVLLGAVLLAAGPELQERFRLDNGMTVVYRHDPASEVTVLLIGIGGGQSAEPVDKAGLAFLTSRLAIDIPDQSKAQDFVVKALHSSLNVRGDFAVIQLECLSEFFDEVAAAFVRILADPLFTGVRIERIKEFMAHQRRLEADDAGNAGRLAQAEAFFAGTGYGRSIYGSEASLAAIKAKDIKDFYDRLFIAGNITLTVVTDLDRERLAAMLKKHFGGFRKSATAPAIPSLASASPAEPSRQMEKEALQTYVSAAYPLPAAGRRNYVLDSLLENALGRGPGTRLWSLRSEQKLAYNVAASALQMKQGGLFEAFLETDPSKTAQARTALGALLAEVHHTGLSAEELDVAKAGLKSLFLRGNETKISRASTLASFEALGLDASFFEAFAKEVDAVTLDEMNAHIRSVLDPAKAHWVLVGPK
ncbi:MAG: pitrilysin family protein [Candidatus Aminicenantes bacterium]|nr:pitrilysin family protein [Candidatus Aminicenantes bacterium]